MSLANPGRRGFLTLLAVILIIGIPGAIAYADDSTDTYYSVVDNTTPPSQVQLYDSVLKSLYIFGVTTAESEDGISVVIDDTTTNSVTSLSDLTSVTRVIVGGNGTLSEMFTKFVFSTSVSSTSASLTLYDSDSTNLGEVTLNYNESTGEYYYEFSSLELVTYADAASFKVAFRFDAVDSSEISTFDCSMAFYSSEKIFTDDIVELMVLVGGVALLIIGTFSLSFIDLDTPGKAFRAAKRGVKSGYRRLKK